ncbi:Dot/Icm T4SS effector Ceg34 [Legionella pneumophila]
MLMIMARVIVTYSPEVGGSSVLSLKESFTHVGSEVIDGDYRKMMEDIPKEEFDKLYSTKEGRQRLFAHAKAKAIELLKNVDVLALSGNNSMIDPELFNQTRDPDQNYDFSRTIAELALVHVATEKGMPILGVCGGHQVIAVYGGGEICDLNSDKLNTQKVMNYDAIKVHKGSLIAQIIGGKQVQKEMDTARKAFNERMNQYNRLSEKLNALEKLNLVQEAGKLDALGKLEELDKSEVQLLLKLTGLNIEEELFDLRELVGEIGETNQLKTELQNIKTSLNGLEDSHPLTSPHYETEFFGAHEQVVSKLAAGFQHTGTASDNESNEAAESEFGVPIITTQFHPEVGAKGLPEAHFFYLRTEAEQEMNLNIFRYLDKAGDAYNKKKNLMVELRQINPKNQDVLLQPSQIKKTSKELQQEREKQGNKSSSKRQTESYFFESILSKIGSYLSAIGEFIREGIGKFLRDILSSMFTYDSVSRLKKKEQKQSKSEHSKIDLIDSKSNSYSTVFHDMKVKSPSEILRENPAKLWAEKDDSHEKTITNQTDMDNSNKVRITTELVQEEVGQEFDENHISLYRNNL